MTSDKYADAVNMKDIIEETRRIACDFVVSSHRGSGGYTQPELTIDAIVELLAGLSVVEDHFLEIIDEGHERAREERRIKAVSK